MSKEYPKMTDSLIVYAVRYAIGRHTYASGEVARWVGYYADMWSEPTRRTLIADIEYAFKKHEVDELSTVDWEQALNSLKSTAPKPESKGKK